MRHECPTVKKMTREEFENLDVSRMSLDQFNRFMEIVADYNGRASRISLDELEAEFDRKMEVLDEEMVRIGLDEFVSMIFNRESRNGVVSPFEERMSFEYRHWLGQVLQIRKSGRGKVDYSQYRMWRYNPVVFYKDEKKRNRHKLLLKDDDECMAFLRGREFAILSPVTYVGRTNSYRNARFLYAFGIDLDGVGTREIGWLLAGMKKGGYPPANIIVNSGHGLHVYYLLETPVAMYETRLKYLNKLKAALTKVVWAVSKLGIARAQVQSVVQGFRIPGTKTKFGRDIVAFHDPDVPMYTLDKLNESVGSWGLKDDELGVLKDRYPHNPGHVRKEEAKKLWPEWYNSRIIEKKRIGKSWSVNRALYDWWLAKLKDGEEVEVHHRYWCILTLVVYAVKCGVAREEVEKDALELVPSFDRKTKTVDNPFTDDDVMDAMRAYDEGYNTWPLRVIRSTTGIAIEKNKRNGRTQRDHVRVMNTLRDHITHPDGIWREGNGRKKGSKVSVEDSRCATLVFEWRKSNPESRNKSKCARETGLSRPTVHKWWNCIGMEVKED